MTVPRDYSVSALLVGDYENDRFLVHDIFHKAGWQLFEARDRAHAQECLNNNRVHVVIARAEGPTWNWKKVLADLHLLPCPPQLIVTSSQADEYLWSEALNFGAFDVLPEPFYRDEVERVVASARRHFEVGPLVHSRPVVLGAA